RVIQTKSTLELPDDFAFNMDMNSGYPLGLGERTTIKGGKWDSSATSYLGPQFFNRPNPHYCLLGTRVTKLVKASKNGAPLALQKVEFSQGKNSSKFIMTTSKEVILSAGTIGTPQVLLNSDIGDSSELGALGIQALHHLPSVGKNASGHPLIGTDFVVNSTNTLDVLGYNETEHNAAFKLWNSMGKGPFKLPGIAGSHVA
ncbi:GMC oxidoreductase, partial [Sphaerobolus stellatus SS14]